MNEAAHPAQLLRQAGITFEIADQRTAELAGKRSPWQRISPRRIAELSGNLTILAKAASLCREAGADPQSPLVAAIHNLHDKTHRQRRNLLAVYGLIAAALLALGAIMLWSAASSPSITSPQVGEEVGESISVNGSSPKAFLLPGTHLYVFVKPLGFNAPLSYWIQPTPVVDLTGWHARVGIGNKDEDRGNDFLICAILTRQALPEGWHDPERPEGRSSCVEVIRQ